MNAQKFAGMAYDVTDFVSEGKIDYLVNLTKGDSDELTKTAHVPSREEAEQLPGEDFALVLFHPHAGFLKKYATGDKYITKLNLKLFADNYDKYPDEISKTAAFYLTQAAKHFQIDVPEPIQKLASGKHISNVVDLSVLNEKAWHEKQASMIKITDTDYALPDKHKYPIDTKEHVKLAVDYFEEHATKFSPLDAITYASRVKTAAEKNAISYTDTMIEKYASLTSSKFNEDYKYHINMRKKLVKDEDKSVYDELLEKSAGFGVIKTAEYLERVDTRLGVSEQWGHKLADPYISVLGMKKEANCKYKGKTVKASMLKKAAENIVDAETLKCLEGPDGIAVFESLPVPIKDSITKNL